VTPAGHFIVPLDHPALPGHFPGAPVLPGVVLLDHVVAAILADLPGCRAAGLPQVKFLRPVRFGDDVEIVRGPVHEGRIAFACRVGGEDVARGAIQVGPILVGPILVGPILVGPAA